MSLHYGFDSLPHFRRPAATVGSYDGVHAGHGALLRAVREEAERRGGESIVLSFDPHPRVTLGRAEGLQLLTTVEEKALLLERAGIDHLVVIPVDEAFSRLTPDVFVRDLLIGRLGIEALVVGYDHRFGHDQRGDTGCLDRLHTETGLHVVRIAEYASESGGKVSSTVLRNLIGRGDLRGAARLLGHPYLLIGEACGREIRIAEPLKLLPPPGRYRATAGECAAPLELTVGTDGRLMSNRDLPSGRIVIAFES